MKALVLTVCLTALISPAFAVPELDPKPGFGTRAVWITRWAFSDSADVRRIFRDLEEMDVNTVFFQVRGACDALYRSSLEPWSDLLSGRLGRDPGWDPLEIALEEGHSRGIDVHAWINVFTGWAVSDSGTPPPDCDPPHVFNAHPEWLATDSRGRRMSLLKERSEYSYAFLSPTHEEAQDHVAEVVRDLVGRYEVDGLHLDYVRFPDSSYSYDADSRAAYRLDMILAGVGEQTRSFGEWRTRRLTDFVGRLARIARTVRPGIQVSAAVWQKIDDGREVYLQDGVDWMLRGHLDFVVPMLYTHSVEAFGERLDTYVRPVGAGNVVAGLGPYLEAFTDSIVAAELDAAAERGVRGYSIFNSDFALKYSDIIKEYGPGR
jgi:uncharacterized lipoprotein YddW (UPF0748 family)